MPATETQSSTHAAKNRRRLIAIGLAVILGILVGGLLLATHWPFSEQKILQAIREAWPGQANVGQFHPTYFPHPGCVMDNVTLERAGVSGGTPLVSIGRVTFVANYHDMLFRPGFLARIVLEKLRIVVPAKNENSSVSASTDDQRSSDTRIGEVFTKDALLEIERQDGSPPLKFDIHKLDLQSINNKSPMSYDLAMRNAEPPGEIESRGKLGPWTRGDLKNIALSGTYAFDHADLGVFHGIAGIISAKGEFQGTLGSIETQGTADTPNFEVTHTKHAVPIKTKFNALVDGTTGNVTLRSVEATIVRTPAHLEGTISSKPGEHGKTTAVNITVREGHIDDVLRIFVREDKPPMEGITNFKAHAVLPPDHRPFEKRIMLEGNFVIERAQWEKPSRQANVDMLSKRASGKKKEPETEKVTADINGSVVLKEGVAKFSSVSFKIPGAEANMHGEYNLESKKIDFHGDLKTAAPLSEDTTGAKAVLLKPLNPLFRRKHAGAQVPVEMTGTYSDPHFGVVIPAKK